MNYDKYAEALHPLLATSTTESVEREDFIKFFLNYTRVIEKNKNIKQSIAEIKNYFNIHDDVESFDFFFVTNKAGVTKTRTFNFVKNNQEIISEFGGSGFIDPSYLIQYLPQSVVVFFQIQECVKINRNHLELSFQGFITQEEQKCYDTIEFFERNKLKKELSVGENKATTLKI